MAFQKGQSGNPLGKRKEKLFFDALMQTLKDTVNPRDLRDIAGKLFDMAVGGDIQAIKEIANRLDGMPATTAEITVEQNFVVRTPDVDPTSDEWLAQNSPTMTIQ